MPDFTSLEGGVTDPGLGGPWLLWQETMFGYDVEACRTLAEAAHRAVADEVHGDRVYLSWIEGPADEATITAALGEAREAADAAERAREAVKPPRYQIDVLSTPVPRHRSGVPQPPRWVYADDAKSQEEADGLAARWAAATSPERVRVLDREEPRA
jgi:hypothetical protein